MATGIKGICFNETSQLNELNSVHFKHSHIRKFCDGTRHFTRLSSKIFDNVIYESIYGVSIPGMSDDIMGGSGKRYSSIISDSGGNDLKRRCSIQGVDDSVHRSPSDTKMVESQMETKKEPILINDSPVLDVKQKNMKNIEAMDETGGKTCEIHSLPPTSPNKGNIEKLDMDSASDKNVSSQDAPRPELVKLDRSKSHSNVTVADSTSDENSTRFRSNSECSIGRTPRNSSQVDITSDPIYKEIYANNLRQYGFLLAKKLGISNQSPRELRATYLQNRQKAELRRERSNSSFSDFSKRLNKPPSPTNDGKRTSVIEVPETGKTTVETPAKQFTPKHRMQRSNTIGGLGSAVKDFPARNRMQRSNTIEYIDRSRDRIIGSVHSRSVSDLTNKYSDSLTNISEIVQEKDSNIPHVSSRRMRRQSSLESRRSSNSPPLCNSPVLSNSTDTIDKKDDATVDSVTEVCHQRVHSGSFSDKEPSKKQPTTVIRRKHKNIRDPHKRLSVPLFNTSNGSSSPPRLNRRLSLPLYTKTEPITSMASLSVPDLYHNSSFGKEKLMDAYCKQEVPRKKLSVESLRRHNEAKERLEWRMSKLKTFEGILSEADSFMKDIRTMKLSHTNTTTTITEEGPIAEEITSTEESMSSEESTGIKERTSTGENTTSGESAITEEITSSIESRTSEEITTNE